MSQTPQLPIQPKVNGAGIVRKKDGSVSNPKPEEKKDGRNPN